MCQSRREGDRTGEKGIEIKDEININIYMFAEWYFCLNLLLALRHSFSATFA